MTLGSDDSEPGWEEETSDANLSIASMSSCCNVASLVLAGCGRALWVAGFGLADSAELELVVSGHSPS